MRGVNRVIIVGRLGNDPEVKQFSNGSGVTNISVATSERWTDKQTGEKKEITEWHRVSMYNKLGEIAAQYLRKGSMVYIEGSLRTRKWKDQNGEDRYATEIRADQMQMLGEAGGNQQQGYQQPMQQQGYQQQPMQQQGYQQQGYQQQPMQQQAFNNQMTANGHLQTGGGSPADDDIPFAPFFGG